MLVSLIAIISGMLFSNILLFEYINNLRTLQKIWKITKKYKEEKKDIMFHNQK